MADNDDTPQPVQGTPDQTGEATNAVILNQVVGKLLDVGSATSAAVIAAINAIASAVTASLLGGTTGTTANRLLRSKGTSGLVVQNSPIGCDDSGNLTGIGNIQVPFATRLIVCTGTTNPGNLATPIAAGTSGQLLTSNGAGSYASFQTFVDGIGGLLSFPQNGVYNIWLNSPFSGTVTSTTTISGSGSCSATFRVNTSPMSGGANAVSPTERTVARNASFNAGDDLTILIASVSSCQYMSFMIAFTRP